MNPWLDIPLNDYEAHMSLDTVRQAQYLADSLEKLVNQLAPKSVAVIGCSGGNGFDRLSPDSVKRVVGVDINPEYIEIAEERYKERFERLELYCRDFTSADFTFAPVDLVFAGLIFEYVDIEKGLESIKRFIKPSGYLGVVLQLPSEKITAVTPSRYKNLEKLETLFNFVMPEMFEKSAQENGLAVKISEREVLSSGKYFHKFLFQNSGK